MTDPLKARLAQERHQGRQKVRVIVAESGHPDAAGILRDFDRALWDVETGVAGARSTWAALSSAQQRVMEALEGGRALTRASWSVVTYNATGGERMEMSSICQWPTVKNLLSRGLIESDNLSDQTKRFVLSSRGRFTLKHGRGT